MVGGYNPKANPQQRRKGGPEAAVELGVGDKVNRSSVHSDVFAFKLGHQVIVALPQDGIYQDGSDDYDGSKQDDSDDSGEESSYDGGEHWGGLPVRATVSPPSAAH
eukprot:scaffold3003_cov279-Pinguiococcus_pyrenoidosus.AAC.1